VKLTNKCVLCKFGVNDGGGNCIGCFEIKIGTDAAKFTNVEIAGFGQSGYLIGERQVLIKDTRNSSRDENTRT